MGISFFKKKRFSPFERRFSYLFTFAMKFQRRHWLEDFAVACGTRDTIKNSGYRGVFFLSVYLFSVTKRSDEGMKCK